MSETLTCWYWPNGLAEREFDVPVPYARTGPADEILAFARELAEGGGCEWVKVFAATELDVRYRWPA